MTKALPRDRFEKFRNMLPMASLTDIQVQENSPSTGAQHPAIHSTR